MSRPLDLASAEDKFNRAKFHAQELLKHIGIWTKDDDDPAIRVGLEDDLKRRRTLAYVKSVKDVPGDWSLMLGDALHDYRSTLNYVAGALILAGRTPERFWDLESSFQFPVCKTTREDFLARSQSQLPGVRLDYLRAISPFQPYKRFRNRWVLPALKRLNDLDKHRKPILATHHISAQLSVVSPSFGNTPPVADLKSLRPRGRVQAGTKLAHFIWLTTDQSVIQVAPFGPLQSEPAMTVRFKPLLAIVLEDLQPDRIVDISRFIKETDGLIEAVLRKVRQV